MTPDEKGAWIAVFAARHESMVTANPMTRGDAIIAAIKEADYTILAMRRVAAGRRRGHLHEVPLLIEEERRGQAIMVSEDTDVSTTTG